RARLRRLEREYAEARALSDQSSNSAQQLLNEARRAGLIAADAVTIDNQGAHNLLQQAAAPRPLDVSAMDDPGAELEELENRRRKLRSDLQEIREEILEIQRINREASEFETEAREQEARLASIGLVPPKAEGDSDVCPICDSRLAVPVPSVADIRKSLAGVEVQLSSVRRDAPRLQERQAGLEKRRADVEEQLRTVHQQITDRIRDNERLRIQQNDFAERARVAGRIAYYLENITVQETGGSLANTISLLKAEIAELEQALDEDSLENRLETALGLISRDLTSYAKALGLEHGDNPLRLDRKNLTVVADTVDGPLALAQMGSGENWVG